MAVALPVPSSSVEAVPRQEKRHSALLFGSLVLLLFLYLYGINWTFLPTYTSRIVLVVAWAALGAAVLVTGRVVLPSGGQIVAALYACYLGWVTLVTLVASTVDTALLVSAVLLFTHSFVGGVFFALLLRRYGVTFRELILLVQCVITVQAFFIMLYFVSWGFRGIVSAYIPELGSVDHQEVLFRSRGLTHGASATLSVIQSIGILLTAYLLATSRHRSVEYAYLLVSFVALCLSVFLSGRTGFLVLPVVFLYFAILVINKMRLQKNIAYFSAALPLVMIGAYFLFRAVYQYVSGGMTMEWGEDVFDRAVRSVTQEFFSDSGVTSRTAEILLDHWIFPTELSVLFFGDPTTWEVKRIPSDIGIVRIWFGLGFVGVLLFYALYLAIFFAMLRKARGLEELMMVLCLCAYLFVTELKEPFLNNVRVNSFVLMFFAYLIYRRSPVEVERPRQARKGDGYHAVVT